MGTAPRVSIGLPVYNGANFLTDAIESILDQTYADFELVISDNGSTDETEAICRRFAALDPRVRYERHDENRGAGWNFEHVRTLARGRDFYKWAAHDDVLAPTFLERCVELLDADPDASVALTGVAAIDDDGKVTRLKHRQVLPQTRDPVSRFKHVVMSDANCEAVFGLIRRTALETTRGQGDYIASDRVLLAELALAGPFVEVPEVLFFNREHPARSVQVTGGDFRLLTSWFAPQKPEQFMPYWRIWREYLNAARRSQLAPSQRRRAYAQLPWFAPRYARRLAGDVVFGARRALRPWKQRSGEAQPTG
jgi:glycosyltransferase involved in cell wall biosynthesis